MKLKSFYTTKETISKGKRQPKVGESIYKKRAQKGLNMQNIQRGYEINIKKKNLNQKMNVISE